MLLLFYKTLAIFVVPILSFSLSLFRIYIVNTPHFSNFEHCNISFCPSILNLLCALVWPGVVTKSCVS